MSLRRTRSFALTVVVCAAVFTTACTVASPGSPSPVASTAPDAALQPFYDQKLSWGPCAPYATTATDRTAFANPKFDCARFEVPLDYTKPDGEKAEIAVLRQKALDQDARIGSLLMNPGGPGASGMSALTSIVSGGIGGGPLAQRFDLIGFDPRGVGASMPKIDCLTDAEQDAEREKTFADPSPAGVAAADANSELYAQRCTERVGTEVLANVGTRDVVRDMDILRAVLGDAKLNYLGYSYGTRIGSAYAEEFPGNVRALVLDGALDPQQSTIDRAVDQNAGFQGAFDAFAAWCSQQQTPCPLGQDPKQATTVFQALVRPLIDNPLPAGPGRVLSFADAQTGVSQALYVSAAYPILFQGIAGLATGDGETLLRLADFYYDRAPDGRYSNTIEAFTVISCVDEERITDRAQVAELNRRADEVAPFRSTGRGPVNSLDPCAFWPVPPTSKPHVPQVSGLPPTLVISVTGDPATPYEAGIDLAKALDGRLLTVEGNQHTAALQGDQCTDEIVTQYFIDLVLPPEGAQCKLA
ncbi:alpha/beta hydrolase [Pseudonocardia asaccharolytica]|uniref:Alpha/beta hydrolase n=1 Tax=Pseudonocardia asaccharolytica DSM 44247 = NBRC 16224 TaxID=1123024 RepID=A0A511D2H7_9PSEU|nr:alpha/beta hydrolase [Pseudonocardia asaccharolytica]GEL18986.1 alpha/beta hydrolase [Pseudonocardia asaccharolytica DSM 44247 = NBRC 16224]